MVVLNSYIFGVAVTTTGDIVEDYQIDSSYVELGITTDELYIEYTKNKMKEFYGRDITCNISIEPYIFMVSPEIVKNMDLRYRR